MKIIEIHTRMTKIMKHVELHLRITKIMKSPKIHARIMKIIKIIEIHTSVLRLSGPPRCGWNGLNANPAWLIYFIYKTLSGTIIWWWWWWWWVVFNGFIYKAAIGIIIMGVVGMVTSSGLHSKPKP